MLAGQTAGIVVAVHENTQSLWRLLLVIMLTGQTAGIVVVVHKNTEMPFPEEEGVFVLPGRSTNIAIRMVSTLYNTLLHTVIGHQ